jgi:hypothetical protein
MINIPNGHMKLDLLWRATGLVSEPRIAEIRYNAWHKVSDYTVEEASYLCDSLRESFDLPPLSLAALDAAEALQGNRWAFCGGTVVNHLVEPRMTKDVDIVTSDRSSAISALLQSHRFHAEGGTLKHVSGGEIDVLNWESGNLDCPKATALQALATARIQRMLGRDVPMVTPAGVIAMKLGRAISNDRKAHQDKGDIVNILIKHGYQDLSAYSLTPAMSDEYARLVEEAKNVRRD